MPEGRLWRWIKRNFRISSHGPADEAPIELSEDARRITELYMKRPRDHARRRSRVNWSVWHQVSGRQKAAGSFVAEAC